MDSSLFAAVQLWGLHGRGGGLVGEIGGSVMLCQPDLTCLLLPASDRHSALTAFS
jgi:hypothetical protein